MATIQELLEVRRVKGAQILELDNQVKRHDANTYLVHSQSSERWHLVQFNGKNWTCNCPDFKFRNLGKCKHTFAVELSATLRSRVETSRTIAPIDLQTCLFCYSKNIVKRGILHNKNGDIQ